MGLKEDVSSEYGFSNSNSLSPNAGAGTGNSTKTDTGTKGTRSRSREKRSARESALALLEYRDRTEQELRQKLLDREYSKDEIEETVRFLREYRYLDDEAYAMRVYPLPVREKERASDPCGLRAKRREPGDHRLLSRGGAG